MQRTDRPARLAFTVLSLNPVFLALLVWHFLFLTLHDWLPLGRWNDLAALRSQRSLRARAIASLSMGLLAGIALYLNWTQSPNPSHGTRLYTLLLYAFMLAGLLRAWWLPYWFGIGLSSKRVDEYKGMFGNTVTWFPVRNGITVNALHTVWHVTDMVTVVLAAIRYFR